ncbi:MAG: alpha/beta hydrolase, partial [Candidatus Omnitrophota bacterium]
LGESLGALISFMLAGKEPNMFNGLICISPAFVNRMKIKLIDYIKIFSSAIYDPKKQFHMPFSSAMCTQDEVYQEVMNHDHREHRLATSGLLMKIAAVQIKSGMIKKKIKIPVLFLLAGKDKLVDPGASRKVFNALKVKDKKIIDYPEMYHALSIELSKDKVFGDIFEWLIERI